MLDLILAGCAPTRINDPGNDPREPNGGEDTKRNIAHLKPTLSRQGELGRAGTKGSEAIRAEGFDAIPSEDLRAVIGAAREQDRQAKWLLVTGTTALAAGLIMSPIFSRLLPFGLDTRVAAAVMATDRWNAGATLMAAENPEAWRELAGAGELVKSNRVAIDACREAAFKAKQPQRCAILVPSNRPMAAVNHDEEHH